MVWQWSSESTTRSEGTGSLLLEPEGKLGRTEPPWDSRADLRPERLKRGVEEAFRTSPPPSSSSSEVSSQTFESGSSFGLAPLVSRKVIPSKSFPSLSFFLSAADASSDAAGVEARAAVLAFRDLGLENKDEVEGDAEAADATRVPSASSSPSSSSVVDASTFLLAPLPPFFVEVSASVGASVSVALVSTSGPPRFLLPFLPVVAVPVLAGEEAVEEAGDEIAAAGAAAVLDEEGVEALLGVEGWSFLRLLLLGPVESRMFDRSRSALDTLGVLHLPPSSCAASLAWVWSSTTEAKLTRRSGVRGTPEPTSSKRT